MQQHIKTNLPKNHSTFSSVSLARSSRFSVSGFQFRFFPRKLAADHWKLYTARMLDFHSSGPRSNCVLGLVSVVLGLGALDRKPKTQDGNRGRSVSLFLMFSSLACKLKVFSCFPISRSSPTRLVLRQPHSCFHRNSIRFKLIIRKKMFL